MSANQAVHELNKRGVVALAGLFLLLIITVGLVIETYARIAFVACFVGIALTIGTGAGRLLR